MAYDSTNPPALTSQMVGGLYREFAYRNTDAVTVVRVSGYITNGKTLGMQKGDRVYYTKTDANPIAQTIMTVSAVNANGSVDLSDGTAIGATNTD